MDRKLTIGLVTPAWPGFATPNGIVTAVQNLAAGLRATGHRPVIIAFAEDGPRPDDTPVIVIRRRPWSIGRKIAARVRGMGEVMAEANGDDIADAVDAAHAAHGLDAVIMEETQGWALRVVRRGRVPVFMAAYGPWALHEAVNSDGSARNQGRLGRETRAFEAVSGIISPTREVLDALGKVVDLDRTPHTRIAYAIPQEPPPTYDPAGPIMFVGRFDRHKGGDTVLEAFARVHAIRPRARLTYIGPDTGVRQDDGRMLKMEEVLSAMPPATRAAVTAMGRQDIQVIAELRKSHPIAIIASRYEVLSYTTLQAMAAGQAIVSTDVGGLGEALEHEKSALMVPPDDPAAMAAALVRLTDDPGLVVRLGTAARDEVGARFVPEVVAGDVVNFLERCLETRGRIA